MGLEILKSESDKKKCLIKKEILDPEEGKYLTDSKLILSEI